MLSDLFIAIIAAMLAVLGSLFVQKRNEDKGIKECALYLYLNLSQTKLHIDEDKKTIQGIGDKEVMPIEYYRPIDYIAILCTLQENFTMDEIILVNNFYEEIRKLDYKKLLMFDNKRDYEQGKIALIDSRNLERHWNEYRNTFKKYEECLIRCTDREAYKVGLVQIISKLDNLKTK